MGIVIHTVVDPNAAAAYSPVAVSLFCDAVATIFCNRVMIFSDADGYIGCHRKAMEAGWLERNGPQGRLWLCPECSGKR